MSETKQITIRLPVDVYAAAVAAAEADRRKLATWIALAIESVVLEAAERD
jgi:predicted HicB family RNase H-like nuclease